MERELGTRRMRWVLAAALLILPIAGGVALAGPAAAPHPPDAGPDTVEPPGDQTPEVPIVLVPGWLDTARDMAVLRVRLLAAGWPAGYVETITFDDPTGSNREHAVELDRAIDSLLAHTGAERVDVVAHSMGGLATRWYLRADSMAPVRRVVFIGTPHRGTLSAHFSWGGGRGEMMPESAFLDTLNAYRPVPLHVRSITIRTSVDTHIVPGESATLPEVPDHQVCCPTHAGLLRDEEVFDIVLEFLGDVDDASVSRRR